MQSQSQMQMHGQMQRPSKTKCHPSNKMKALQIHGKESLKMMEVPMPMITDSTDVIVKVTATSICGSDLHTYKGMMPGMKKGDIIGHECVGVVEETGPHIKKVKKGDRVIVSPVIACGECDCCKRGETSCCDTTCMSTSETQEPMRGHNTAAMLGSTSGSGCTEGCQSEFVRVPFGDVNLFPIPDSVSDKEAILVADVASSGLHGCVLADVKEGDRVVVMGCGPVGMMTQMWAKQRGASMVVGIDVDQQRLSMTKEKFGSMIINAKEEDPLQLIQTMMPGGPDKIIDCVGSQFPDTWWQRLGMKLKLETDAPNIVNLAIQMVKKNGRITLIGDYSGYTNHFNIGGLMEKHLTINGGQLWPHRYAKEILDAISSKKINPTSILTHSFPMSKIDEAYKMFDKHESGMVKPLIVPDSMYHEGNIMGMDMRSK